MRNILKYLVLVSLLALTTNVFSTYASTPFTLEAYGIDTIAGYSASIRSSKTLANKNVIFTVIKPNGTELTIPIESDENGIAEFDLYDYHTKQAGTYKVMARLEKGENGNVNTFEVFADEVSTLDSSIDATKLLATADGVDKVYVTVKLKDRNGNPIKGHVVEVISSRNEDTVQRISEKQFTDKNGSLIFGLSSIKKGVSIYSFIDTTATKVLEQRLEIAYTELNNAGGFIPTAYAAAGEVSSLRFEGLPSSINANSDVSFTLSAIDSEGDIVPNYAGDVHFSAEGANSVYASLPNDYTFDVDLDSGSHTFSGVNSLNFSQEGTYRIVATDLDDFSIRGEVDITVGPGTQPPPGEQPTEPSTTEISITSPSPGTYSDNRIAITGTSPLQTLTIQIFDNDQNIGSTSVDPDNTFRYEPSILSEGNHTVFAVGLDQDGIIQSTSEEVTFTIDTTPPVVEDITFSPSSGIKTGDVIDIIVISEPDVFQGAVVFNIDIAELEPDPLDSTKYLASIQAPLEVGTYPVDVILVDELGNEGSYEDIASVEVTEDGDAKIIGMEEPTGPSEPVPTEEQPPGDVFGVKATSSDQRVTLTWQPATDDTGIDHYRIYYGLTPANLSSVVDTFDNNTTWYIPDLQNGNEYFFSVTAIDDDGLESTNRSSIVSAIPFTSAPVFIMPEPVEPVQPAAVRPVAPSMQATGPEVLWFLLASFFISQLYFKFKKKMC